MLTAKLETAKSPKVPGSKSRARTIHPANASSLRTTSRPTMLKRARNVLRCIELSLSSGLYEAASPAEDESLPTALDPLTGHYTVGYIVRPTARPQGVGADHVVGPP